MARSAKRGGKKRRAKYTNRQQQQNKIKSYRKRQKKQKKMACSIVDSVWDQSKTTKQNMDEMGLVYDLNKTLKLPSTKDQLIVEDTIVEDTMDVTPSENNNLPPASTKRKKMSKKKRHKAKRVLLALETEAAKESAAVKRLPNAEVLFCVRMIERHGENYEAMSRDPNNHYQLTGNQIKHKINLFKQTFQYNAYLTAKSAGVLPPIKEEQF